MAGIGSSNGGLTFSITVPGQGALSVTLSRFASELGDFTAFWNGKFKTFWYALRQLDYASAGGATGPIWAPLSPAYRAWKNAHYPSAPLLVREGRLKASVTQASAPGSVWRTEPQSLHVGTSVPYALYHQRGTSRMPARPPVRLASTDLVRIGKLLQEFVADSWKQRRAAARTSAA